VKVEVDGPAAPPVSTTRLPPAKEPCPRRTRPGSDPGSGPPETGAWSMRTLSSADTAGVWPGFWAAGHNRLVAKAQQCGHLSPEAINRVW